MAKIYSYVAGNTLEAHQKFLKKLTKKGAKTVNSPEEREATIVFCPIVSRFESDINAALDAALSKIPDLGSQKVILVAMHHTFDPNYTLPNTRDRNPLVTFQVDCLFYKDMGLFRCARNKMAWKKVREELGLRAGPFAKIPKN